MNKKIRPFQPEDFEAVNKIYQQGIDTNLATLQAACPTWEEWNTSHLEECRYVYLIDGRVVGWIALTPVSNRCVYAGVAEVSIYVADDAKKQGIGTALLQKTAQISEEYGIWTLQSNIIQDNAASIELHKKCGFRIVGYREKLGRDRFGVWQNITLMERRSKLI